jgi:hypothetical protein
MQSIVCPSPIKIGATALLVLLILVITGCQTAFVGPAPVGPGAATVHDLTPWLPTATNTQQIGCLMEFNVPSTQGSYDTWGLATAIAEQSVEVDVRGCPGQAEDFRGKQVAVKGRLIERGKYNLPLLVADQIVPVDEYGNPLPDSRRHLPKAAEADPVTNDRDPIADFGSSGAALSASAN